MAEGLRRGTIVWCDLEDDPRPTEAGRRRPALVISSSRMTAGPVVVIPLTTTPRPYPTVVELDEVLPRTSYIQCEQLRAVARSRIGSTIAVVDAVTMMRVEAVLRRLLEL